MCHRARATSAAPTLFKPFVNDRTNEGYLDGALFHNNPAKLANYERKLIWPDSEGHHPDILLSIGTGHNGRDTTSAAEPHFRNREYMQHDTISSPRDRRQGFRSWFRGSVLHHLAVMVNRVDNILDCEQSWLEFLNEVLDSRVGINSKRYERFNPNLGFRPPRLDEKAQLGYLQQTVVDRITRRAPSRIKIRRIAHRLVGSSFYFERLAPTRSLETSYVCTGKSVNKPSCFITNTIRPIPLSIPRWIQRTPVPGTFPEEPART